MRIFNLTAPNFMVNKTYKVSQGEGVVNISVSSPFVGNWDFEISQMTYEQVCSALNLYCAGALAQNCFPSLPAAIRENFITPPSLWKNIDD